MKKIGILGLINFSYLKILLKDLLIIRVMREINRDNQKFIEAAIHWISTAQDVNLDSGVPSSYSFIYGWGASYPEVTGYIIPTFFDYYYLTKEEKIKKRAIQMTNWLVSIQFPNGAFQEGDIDIAPQESVFNTGQILEGLVRAYKETKNINYWDSAKKAADWLCFSQEEDGYWKKYNFKQMERVYDTRVSLSLIKFYKIASHENLVYLEKAKRNIDWAIRNQNNNGWFNNCDNSVEFNLYPLTNTIAYTVEGILESGTLLNDNNYIKAAEKTANTLLKIFERDKILFARYDSDWKPKVRYVCLTGCAQISFIWLRLFEILKDARYLNAALKMNDFLISTQDLKSQDDGIYGGIKGSLPIWGSYERFQYLSWATKFFLDALILEDRVMKSFEKNECSTNM